jgi:23S rRNA (cytidine1920-2'-O)/16S rRNA (cytidine1409-2'-O)-methyltransferase
VIVSGSVAERPSRLVGPEEPITLTAPPPRFVGRGGDKLDAALDRFGLDVAGARALDAGASTGGFTDCLLQRGAAAVVTVDVGRGQLHDRLRRDHRVTVFERTHIKDVTLETLHRPPGLGAHPPDPPDPFDLVVADLSFISLRSVASVLVRLARPGAPLVVLVKPQFEAGRREASRGKGVIRDPQIWREALDSVMVAFHSAGATMMGVMVSPLRGADGNVEFFAHLVAGPAPAGTEPPSVAAEIVRAVHEAAASTTKTATTNSPAPTNSPTATPTTAAP